MALSWIDLNAALELVECERDALVRACRDGDVDWRARDARGLLEPPYEHLWHDGQVDWTACPPRFAMTARYEVFTVGERFAAGDPTLRSAPPASPPLTWCAVQVERRSLLDHFGIREPLEVRIVEPVSVRIVEWLAGLVGARSGRRATAATPKAALATIAELKELFDQMATERGYYPGQRAAYRRAQEIFKERCPTRDTVEAIVRDETRNRGAGRPTG